MVADDLNNIPRILSSEVFDQDFSLTMKILFMIAAILSLLAALYIIMIYLFYPHIRNFAFKMVFYLNIADCCFSIGQLLTLGSPYFLFNVEKSEPLCLTQAFMITWFGLSSIIWTSIIAWTLYSTVIMNNTDIESKEAKYLLWGFVLPMIIAFLPFINGKYGQTGPWCWFQSNYILEKVLYELCFLYFELWIAFVFNTVIIYKVIGVLKLVGVTSDRTWVIKLRFYPFILILCWGWGSIHKIYELVTLNPDQRDIHWMVYLMIFCSSLQGIFNAIIYGMNANVRKILKNHFSCRFGGVEIDQKERIIDKHNAVELDSVHKNNYRDSTSSTYSYDHYDESMPDSLPHGFNHQVDDKRTSININSITEYVLK